MKKEYIPLLERPAKKEDFDDRLRKKREANPDRYNKEDTEECTFQPNKNKRRGGKVDPNKSVDRLLEWGRIREGKVAKRRIMNAENEEIYSFQPHLSERSNRLAQRTGIRDIPIHERLLKSAKDKERWIKNQRKMEKDGLYKPYICKK